MKQYWERIEAWIKKNRPEFLDDLNPGATEEEFEVVEKIIQVHLPEDLKEFYRCHNGQKSEFEYSLFFGCDLLSLEEIARQWNVWKDVGADGVMNEDMEADMASMPEGVIKHLYTSERWIPFIHDGGGNHIGIDYDPDEEGIIGQIIVFGRDEDVKLLAARTFTEFIDEFSRDLEQDGFMREGRICNRKDPDGHYHNKWLKKYAQA
jgi:cell wall assembly regulator SMI1